MDVLIQLWGNWYFHDAVVGALLVLLGWIVWTLAHREYWRVALRQVFARGLVTGAFAILCVYGAIALLDSVGYHPVLRDENGEARLNSKTGEALIDERGVSLLDLALSALRETKEKTYSAPSGAVQFTKETMTNERGEVVRDFPPLKFPGGHLLGTDRIGVDVLYMSLKGVRTGIIIGAVTTLLVVPFAIFFGVVAGYFGGWIDDLIQYFYTVLSSIPSVLLIVAFMIVFGRGLPQLCIVLGITSWTGLCRILRGESMKLREMDFVQAAEAMGVSRLKIMLHHIVPNVMHLVLITAVLSFSGRILAEAVLTYIGIGVGSDTASWGVMINDARLELARDPIIWWKLFAAFIFMLGLVLPANLFGDALRDALDPRLRTE